MGSIIQVEFCDHSCSEIEGEWEIHPSGALIVKDGEGNIHGYPLENLLCWTVVAEPDIPADTFITGKEAARSFPKVACPCLQKCIAGKKHVSGHICDYVYSCTRHGCYHHNHAHPSAHYQTGCKPCEYWNNRYRNLRWEPTPVLSDDV